MENYLKSQLLCPVNWFGIGFAAGHAWNKNWEMCVIALVSIVGGEALYQLIKLGARR